MGDLIKLSERRLERMARPRGAPLAATFSFDLACPFSYLAAERVERRMPGVRWQPVLAEILHRGSPYDGDAGVTRARAAAQRRAAELGIPLVWPDEFPPHGRRALRAAAYAAESGRGAEFALAASRLAWCGGFDLEDPETLAEAAAAASLDLDGCLAAARDEARDGALEERARELLAAGATRLPVVRVGRRLFSGEQGVRAAMALTCAPGSALA